MHFQLHVTVQRDKASDWVYALTSLYPNAIVIEHDSDVYTTIVIEGDNYIELLHAATAVGCTAISPKDPFPKGDPTRCVWCSRPFGRDETPVTLNQHGDRVHSGECMRLHTMSQIEGFI